MNIFLGSSIVEFQEERNDIGDFINRINNELIRFNYNIKLFECEFAKKNVESKRKQEIYNEVLRNECTAMIMIVGKRLR